MNAPAKPAQGRVVVVDDPATPKRFGFTRALRAFLWQLTRFGQWVSPPTC